LSLRSSSWALLDSGASVRIAGSLADLAQGAGPVERASLMAALETIAPLYSPFEHPLRDLTDCAQAARELVQNPEYQLSESDRQVIVAAYEAGLLNGYDADADTVLYPETGGFPQADVACAYAAAWRHGNAIRRRWRAYEHLVSTLVGDRQP
jgi:hypothetical protein